MTILDAGRGLGFSLVLMLALVGTGAAVAGDGDYETGTDDKGPSFFVEAKDLRSMAPLPDVRVRGQIKDTNGSVVGSTDPDGRARLRGFGDGVAADNVIVSCSKAGFKAVEVLRREMSRGEGAVIEVECLMELG